jgi:hypothetical protein
MEVLILARLAWICCFVVLLLSVSNKSAWGLQFVRRLVLERSQLATCSVTDMACSAPADMQRQEQECVALTWGTFLVLDTTSTGSTV